MPLHLRGIKKHSVNLASLGIAVSLWGCDALVSPQYLGESRLQLRVSVENSAPANKLQKAIIPALAHPQGGRIRFSSASVRGEFPADFQVDVFGEPSAEQDAFDVLAPDSAVAFLYLAAIPRSRLDRDQKDKDLLLPGGVIHPVCWDGSCDDVPGRRPEPKDEGCPEGGCPLSPIGDGATQLLNDLIGFAQDHVVVYARAALAAHSWPALRLGVPDGLAAGYHLFALQQPDADTQQRADACFARATADLLDHYNAAHSSNYGAHALDCLIIPFEGCGPRDAPTGAAARELAAGLAQAEIDGGCLGIAQDLTLVTDSEHESITVRIGDLLPDLHVMPSVSRETPAEAP